MEIEFVLVQGGCAAHGDVQVWMFTPGGDVLNTYSVKAV